MFKSFKENYRATSMRYILITSFVGIVVLAIIFIGLALNAQFVRTSYKSISENSNEIVEQVKINIDNYFYNMIDLSDLLVVNITEGSDFDADEFSTIVETIKRTRRDVISISLFDERGNHISNHYMKEVKDNERIKNQEWFYKINNEQNYFHISLPHVQDIYAEEFPWVISLSRRIGYREDGVYKNGTLLIDMNFAGIEELLDAVNLGKRGYVYLVDEHSNIVYHNQQQLLYSGMKSENVEGIENVVDSTFLQNDYGNKRFMTVKVLNNTAWKLVGVYYESDFNDAQSEVNTYVTWILIIGVAVFVSISIFMSSRISKPILELEKSMKAVEQGNFDIQLDVKGEYEVVQLSKTFNLMINKIRTLMDQIVLEQEAKRKSELSALQAQINPHFLYNTLDSIIWMAENEKHNEVVEMVNALASLFRISISRGNHIISVKDELRHAENYLIIQKIRYKDKFDFRFEVDENVNDYRTLKLILQPIIENAIYHGIRHMVDEGEIVIKAHIVDDSLLFKIIDDGLGMDEDTAVKVLHEKSDSGSGVGISNVHERIQLMYGSDYGLSIESEIEEGTVISIKIPLVGKEA